VGPKQLEDSGGGAGASQKINGTMKVAQETRHPLKSGSPGTTYYAYYRAVSSNLASENRYAD